MELKKQDGRIYVFSGYELPHEVIGISELCMCEAIRQFRTPFTVILVLPL